MKIPEKNCDYLICGQGLAGTVLALTLLRAGKSVIIIDEPSLSSASETSAGIVIPVVFRRLTKSWMIDELLPVMEEFYSYAENLLGERFYFHMEIVKLLADQTERDFWLRKAGEDMGRYLDTAIMDSFLPGKLLNRNGAALVRHSGQLYVAGLVRKSAGLFREKELLVNERFNYDDLELFGDHISYHGITAKKIIFCEGYRAAGNPWFSWLPFRLTKGELLVIRTAEPLEPLPLHIINKAVFIMPLGGNLYKVGATHEWDDLTDEITAQARAELVEKLDQVLQVPYEIVSQHAGVRPAVNDRRPLLGLHPEHPELAVFNGLGTKAVMLAPYFAAEMTAFLSGTGPLTREADIGRFR